MHYKFTGKERDSESGLDDFGARYYASSMGRFMSPDWSAQAEPVPYSKLDNPQSLNLYSYVDNNPLDKVDPDGHRPIQIFDRGFNGYTGPAAIIAAIIGQNLDAMMDGGKLAADKQKEAQQQNSRQKWEAKNEAKTKASIASYPAAPAGARMTLTGCENKSCNYTLTGVSGTFYVYEHFANDGVAGSKPGGHGDFTTSLTGSAGGYREDQITAFGLGTLDQHRFFTISPSETYDPNKQMSVMVFEAGHDVSFEHLYDAAPNAPSYVIGIPTASYHP